MRRAILITTAAAALLAGTALASAQGFVHQAGWAIQQGALAAEGDAQPMLVRHRLRSHWLGPYWRGSFGAFAYTPRWRGYYGYRGYYGRIDYSAYGMDPVPRGRIPPRNWRHVGPPDGEML